MTHGNVTFPRLRRRRRRCCCCCCGCVFNSLGKWLSQMIISCPAETHQLGRFYLSYIQYESAGCISVFHAKIRPCYEVAFRFPRRNLTVFQEMVIALAKPRSRRFVLPSFDLHLFAACQTLRTVSIRYTGISTPGLRRPDPSIPPPQQGCGLCSLRGCHATESHSWTCRGCDAVAEYLWAHYLEKCDEKTCELSGSAKAIVPWTKQSCGGSYICTSVFVHTQSPTDLCFWRSNKAFSKPKQRSPYGSRQSSHLPRMMARSRFWSFQPIKLSGPSSFSTSNKVFLKKDLLLEA